MAQKNRSKVHEWLKTEKLLQIEGWRRNGLSEADIANNIGVTLRTVTNWKQRHPEIAKAMRIGKEVADIRIENSLYKSAMGYHYNEEYITNDGRVVEIRKYSKPNVSAQIFWLKNRGAGTWNNSDHDTLEKVKAETELIKAKIKSFDVNGYDTSLLDELIRVTK